MLPSKIGAAAIGCGTCVGNRLCRRRWAKPTDPKTPAQLGFRARLSAASAEYSRVLTEAQRQACIAAGAEQRSRVRLRQSGKLSGKRYRVKQRCAAKTPVPPAKAGGGTG